MSRPVDIEEFIPHYEPVSARDIRFALADLNPVETTPGPRGGLRIDLPHTRREDGTVDTIEIGDVGDGPGSEWTVFTGRSYDYGSPSSSFNITSKVAQCPGHMVLLVVRGLYAYLTAAGPQGRTDAIESDVMYALGLVRPVGER